MLINTTIPSIHILFVYKEWATELKASIIYKEKIQDISIKKKNNGSRMIKKLIKIKIYFRDMN